MRRDLIIGIIVSLTLNFGVAWLGELSKYKAPPRPKDDSPTIALMEMPKIEPDEPEVVDDTQPTTAPVDLAPMQPDVTQVVTPESFIQPLQPPPPEGLKSSASVVIPQNRPTGLGKGMVVFEPSQLDQQPVPTFQVRPQYPYEMSRQGITGEVIVDLIVDEYGSVTNAFALHASQREFEVPAVQAVSKWKFKPGRKNGRAVKTHVQAPVEFRLND